MHLSQSVVLSQGRDGIRPYYGQNSSNKQREMRVYYYFETWRSVNTDLLRIQGTLNQHGYHSILQWYAIPSGMCLVGLSFVFQEDNDPKPTFRLCKGYLTKESGGVLHQMTWPPQSPDLNPFEMVWDELASRVNEKQPTSAQHVWKPPQDCWKSIPG